MVRVLCSWVGISQYHIIVKINSTNHYLFWAKTKAYVKLQQFLLEIFCNVMSQFQVKQGWKNWRILSAFIDERF